MAFMSSVAKSVYGIILWVLSAALVVYVWYDYSPIIVNLMDLNLRLIKYGCSYIPAPYGTMAESALRAGLGADKALLFAEGSGLLRFVLGYIGYHLFFSPKRDVLQHRKK
jgi:hypothetical protein